MAGQEQKKPNILVIWGDDIGITNLSCYSGNSLYVGYPLCRVLRRLT